MKIEDRMIAAIRGKKEFQSENTLVSITPTAALVLLYGHLIAIVHYEDQTVLVDHCNMKTKLTKSRINAILTAFTDRKLSVVKNQWEINGKPFKTEVIPITK